MWRRLLLAGLVRAAADDGYDIWGIDSATCSFHECDNNSLENFTQCFRAQRHDCTYFAWNVYQVTPLHTTCDPAPPLLLSAPLMVKTEQPKSWSLLEMQSNVSGPDYAPSTLKRCMNSLSATLLTIKDPDFTFNATSKICGANVAAITSTAEYDAHHVKLVYSGLSVNMADQATELHTWVVSETENEDQSPALGDFVIFGSSDAACRLITWSTVYLTSTQINLEPVPEVVTRQVTLSGLYFLTLLFDVLR